MTVKALHLSFTSSYAINCYLCWTLKGAFCVGDDADQLHPHTASHGNGLLNAPVPMVATARVLYLIGDASTFIKQGVGQLLNTYHRVLFIRGSAGERADVPNHMLPLELWEKTAIHHSLTLYPSTFFWEISIQEVKFQCFCSCQQGIYSSAMHHTPMQFASTFIRTYC